MIFIVKTNDNRLGYLKQFLEYKERCLYQDTYNFETDIDKVVLPLDGIDQFGYIKHTNICLEKLLKTNKVSIVYTGVINEVLKKYSMVYGFKIFSFYEDIDYLRKEFLIKSDVIKTFLEEKFNTRLSELKVLVLGNDYKSYLFSEKLNCSIYDKGSMSNKSVKDFSFDNYDVFINFNCPDLTICKEKVIIDMNEMPNIDLQLLLKSKNIFFIEQLLTQYLTKSGGKILYDSMVNR